MKWKLFLQCAVALFPLMIYGKGGFEHAKDMMSVFGPSDHKQIKSFFLKVSYIIDENRHGLGGKIKSIAPRYTEGDYGHRIYFHWGFNGDPKDSQAFKERVEAATTDMQLQASIYAIVREEQRKRNTHVLDYAKEHFLDPNDRSMALKPAEINAIATLAYDTHIIGDYMFNTKESKKVTMSKKALMPMDKLMEDVCKVFDRITREDEVFRNNPNRKVLVKTFRRRMKEAANKSSQKDAAEGMLRIMRDTVPQLLRMTDRIRRMLQLKDLEEAEFRKAA